MPLFSLSIWFIFISARFLVASALQWPWQGLVRSAGSSPEVQWIVVWHLSLEVNYNRKRFRNLNNAALRTWLAKSCLTPAFMQCYKTKTKKMEKSVQIKLSYCATFSLWTFSNGIFASFFCISSDFFYFFAQVSRKARFFVMK